MGRRRSNLAYWCLLAVQSLAALSITAFVHSAFRTMIDSIGVQQQMSVADLVLLGASIFVGQICYWVRFYKIEIPTYRNAAIGHVFAFGGKIGFIMGGALFSLFFLRHMPEIAQYHNVAGLVWRGAIVIATIFALYCYTFELERLGTTMQLDKSR